jgi:hypothetical protein
MTLFIILVSPFVLLIELMVLGGCILKVLIAAPVFVPLFFISLGMVCDAPDSCQLPCQQCKFDYLTSHMAWMLLTIYAIILWMIVKYGKRV